MNWILTHRFQINIPEQNPPELDVFRLKSFIIIILSEAPPQTGRLGQERPAKESPTGALSEM